MGFGPETDTTRRADRRSCQNDAWFGRGEVASRLARGVRDGKEALTRIATRRKDYLDLGSTDVGRNVPGGGLRGTAGLARVLTAREDVGGEDLGGGDFLRCEREGVSVRFRRTAPLRQKAKKRTNRRTL